MKPWIATAMVWVGVLGLGVLVVERIAEVRGAGQAAWVGAGLLVLIVMLGMFATGCRRAPRREERFARECGLEDWGSAPPDGTNDTRDSLPAAHGSEWIG